MLKNNLVKSLFLSYWLRVLRLIDRRFKLSVKVATGENYLACGLFCRDRAMTLRQIHFPVRPDLTQSNKTLLISELNFSESVFNVSTGKCIFLNFALNELLSCTDWTAFFLDLYIVNPLAGYCYFQKTIILN